jgi:FlaA1/EpsC-like NDP-sugar epimerase
VLADICDQVRVQDLFEHHRPDVVFHAAAQKHVPILERYPVEAVRTNVFGTWNLISTAAEHGTRHFVHISTDKAADPCSVMGATKRAAEQMVFEVGRRHQLPFVAVRFGNVLGSRGSVVPTFLRQIVEGGPVTVTSPEMTRYFMTIPEAVSLVLQSGAMAEPGRIYLLDMGEPVSILSLARQLIRLAGLRPGEDVKISIVGTRPGERLHERLHDDAESIEPSSHPSIASLNPKTPWRWDDLLDALATLRKSVDARDDAMVRHQLESMLRKGGVDCELDHGDVTVPVAQHPGSPRAAAIVRDLSEKRAERRSVPETETGTST